MGTPSKAELLEYSDKLVGTYALDAAVAQEVNIHAQHRGGVGGRGYGKNKQGLEIAWWVHPKRVHQELGMVLDRLDLKGNERIVTIGCGPAFHEITIAKHFPNIHVTATDFDAKEIETAKKVAADAGVTNVEFHAMPGEQVSKFAPESFDHAFSIAVLHDVPGLDECAKGLSKVMKKGGVFALTYNGPRQRAQFPEQPSLRDTIAKYFKIEWEFPLVTRDHSREYFGAIADRSEKERGYPLTWDAMSARLA
jgi:SAM-dependent methyltransferase